MERGSHLLILHVNDNTDDQVLFQAAAEEAGVPIEWHVAESVDRGISYLRSMLTLSRKQTVRWVDLVLMDIALKDGSGLSVLKFIRNTPELRDLPVVAFTGQVSPGILREAHDLGITAIYEKPIKFQDTVKLATEIFGRWATVVHTSK